MMGLPVPEKKTAPILDMVTRAGRRPWRRISPVINQSSTPNSLETLWQNL